MLLLWLPERKADLEAKRHRLYFARERLLNAVLRVLRV